MAYLFVVNTSDILKLVLLRTSREYFINTDKSQFPGFPNILENVRSWSLHAGDTVIYFLTNTHMVSCQF